MLVSIRELPWYKLFEESKKDLDLRTNAIIQRVISFSEAQTIWQEMKSREDQEYQLGGFCFPPFKKTKAARQGRIFKQSWMRIFCLLDFGHSPNCTMCNESILYATIVAFKRQKNQQHNLNGLLFYTAWKPDDD